MIFANNFFNLLILRMRIFKLQYYEKWQHWMLNEPKSFTPAGNLRSPGYGKAIKWISEIWTEFDSTILARSFDQCGITSGNPDDYHLQLRQFVRTQKFMDTIVPADPADMDTLFSAPRDGDAMADATADFEDDDDDESGEEHEE